MKSTVKAHTAKTKSGKTVEVKEHKADLGKKNKKLSIAENNSNKNPIGHNVSKAITNPPATAGISTKTQFPALHKKVEKLKAEAEKRVNQVVTKINKKKKSK